MMTRNDAIDLARAHALAHGQDHAYLPTSDSEAAEWLPHAWVVDAIVSAASGREQFARIAETITIRPYETALEISRRIAERIRGEAMTAESDWTDVDLWSEIHRLRAAVKGPDGYASWQQAATAERVRRARYERELRNISEAQRFDRSAFEDDSSFAAWSQNRARHALDDAWPERQPNDVPCECAHVGPDYCPRHAS